MKHDIRNEQDVAHLVDAFYQKATVDPVIGHFFTTVIQLDWSKHIPVINSFWNSILFGRGGYSGNPMEAHIRLDRISPMEQRHFDAWLRLWKETIDENFEGAKADEAKVRAESIAHIMSIKLRN